MNKFLIVQGGEATKSAGGVVEGWGIVFGSPSQPDSSSMRDFFTTETFVRPSDTFDIPLYLDHGLKYKECIGTAVMAKEGTGWKVIAQLDLDNAKAQEVYEDMQSNKYGFSTGALGYLVQRKTAKNKTNHITHWPAGEISLTKRPAEKRAVVESIKSLDGEAVYEDAFEPMNTITLKKLDDKKFSEFSASYQIMDFDEDTEVYISIHGDKILTEQEIKDKLIAMVNSPAREADEDDTELVTYDELFESDEFRSRVAEIAKSLYTDMFPQESEQPDSSEDEDTKSEDEPEDLQATVESLKASLFEITAKLEETEAQNARLIILAGAEEILKENK